MQDEQSFRSSAVFLAALIAMIGSFGAWRRGWESFGLGGSAALAVAIVADVFLMLILLANEEWWTSLTMVRRTVPRWSWVGVVSSLGLRIGLLYLYGWISLRGGGDWWDLF